MGWLRLKEELQEIGKGWSQGGWVRVQSLGMNEWLRLKEELQEMGKGMSEVILGMG